MKRMKKIKKEFCSLLAVLTCVSAHCAHMKAMNWRLPLMDKAPTVDGHVGEEEWQAAHGSFGFLKYPSSTVSPVKTRFWVGRTKGRLFLAGIGEIGPSGLSKSVKARRGNIFCQSNFDLVGTESFRTPSGDIQPSSGIFNQRAQTRRCAVLQAEHGWIDRKNWVHMTNTALAPVLSFAGMNYDWEDVAGDSALQERYPKEAMQAQSLGRQFGNRVAVMAYFSTSDKEKLKWLHRTGVGACLVHEFNWHRVKEWREIDARITAWGYRNPTTRVWNYFDEDVPFPVEIRGGCEASLAMTRSAGGSLLSFPISKTEATAPSDPTA